MQKSIIVKKILRKQGSSARGSWTLTTLKDSIGEYYSTFTPSTVETIQEGSKVELIFKPARKPGNYDIEKIISIQSSVSPPKEFRAHDEIKSIPPYDFKQVIKKVKLMVKENFGEEDYALVPITAELLRERFSIWMEEKIQSNKLRNMASMRGE